MRAIISALLLNSVSSEICKVLALSGGGDRGSYEAGAIRGLVEHLPAGELDWDVVTGVSVGALNAVSSLLFEKGREQEWSQFLQSSWFDIHRNKIYKRWKLGVAEGIAKRSGLYNNEPLRELVTSVLASRPRVKSRLLSVVGTDLTQASVRVWDEQLSTPELVEAVVASAAIPAFFPTSHIGGNVYTDGGALQNLDIATGVHRCISSKRASRLEDVVVDIVVASPATTESAVRDMSSAKTVQVAARVFEMRNKVSNARYIRDAMDAFPEVRFRFLLAPSKTPAGWSVGMDQRSIRHNFELGVRDAVEQAEVFLQEAQRIGSLNRLDMGPEFEKRLEALESAAEAANPVAPHMIRRVLEDLVEGGLQADSPDNSDEDELIDELLERIKEFSEESLAEDVWSGYQPSLDDNTEYEFFERELDESQMSDDSEPSSELDINLERM